METTYVCRTTSRWKVSCYYFIMKHDFFRSPCGSIRVYDLTLNRKGMFHDEVVTIHISLWGSSTANHTARVCDFTILNEKKVMFDHEIVVVNFSSWGSLTAHSKGSNSTRVFVLQWSVLSLNAKMLVRYQSADFFNEELLYAIFALSVTLAYLLEPHSRKIGIPFLDLVPQLHSATFSLT